MMRIEVRFQPPAPEPPPPMQFQHLDPSNGENEAPLGAIAEPVDGDRSQARGRRHGIGDGVAGVAERDPNDPATWGKIGRNEPCPCGSGKKFKHCHGQLV